MLTKALLKTFFSIILIALFCVCPVQAQSTDSLVLYVTVTNEKGVLSRGLTMENFSVMADKQAQKILALNDRDVPSSVGILIDTSGSQNIGNSEAAIKIHTQFREGFERFFQLTNPANEYFLATFNSKVQLLQDWTSDTRSVVEKFDSFAFTKETSMYDAIKFGAEKVKTGHNTRHVLILVSDGMDSSSKVSFKHVRDLLKASDVLLYCVGVNNVLVGDPGVPIPDTDGPKILNELGANSGGRSLFMTNASGPKAFKEVFELIALELRAQYQLVIAPDHAADKTKWRKIKIDAQRDSKQLIARTRQWYYR